MSRTQIPIWVRGLEIPFPESCIEMEFLHRITKWEFGNKEIDFRVKKRKLAYKVNFAQALSSMKNTVIQLLFNTMSKIDIIEWLQTIARMLSAIRPDRHFVRKKKSTDRHKFYSSYKRAL